MLIKHARGHETKASPFRKNYPHLGREKIEVKKKTPMNGAKTTKGYICPKVAPKRQESTLKYATLFELIYCVKNMQPKIHDRTTTPKAIG